MAQLLELRPGRRGRRGDSGAAFHVRQPGASWVLQHDAHRSAPTAPMDGAEGQPRTRHAAPRATSGAAPSAAPRAGLL